jgi:hypothetical protein
MTFIVESPTAGESAPQYRLDPSVVAAANVASAVTPADGKDTQHMSKMTEGMTYATEPDLVADRYLAVWSEPDPERRRRAIAGLWAPDGIEFVEGVQFRGYQELEARIAEAHRAFVESGKCTVASADDVTVHRDIVTFTIQLISAGGDRAGQVAWAARVFLVLGADGLIRQDYQLTVQPLAAE